MRRTPALIAVCASLGLVAAGCGGSGKSANTGTATTTTATTAAATPLTKAQYDRAMTAIGRSLAASMDSVSTAKSAKQAAADYKKVQARFRLAQKQLLAITPPPKVKAAHARLAKAVGDFADQLKPVIAKLAAGHIEAIGAIATLPAFKQLQAAAGEIVKAGYKINT
jgi:hypothetical protein